MLFYLFLMCTFQYPVVDVIIYALMLVCRFGGILFCYRQIMRESLPVDQHL